MSCYLEFLRYDASSNHIVLNFMFDAGTVKLYLKPYNAGQARIGELISKSCVSSLATASRWNGGNDGDGECFYDLDLGYVDRIEEGEVLIDSMKAALLNSTLSRGWKLGKSKVFYEVFTLHEQGATTSHDPTYTRSLSVSNKYRKIIVIPSRGDRERKGYRFESL